MWRTPGCGRRRLARLRLWSSRRRQAGGADPMPPAIELLIQSQGRLTYHRGSACTGPHRRPAVDHRRHQPRVIEVRSRSPRGHRVLSPGLGPRPGRRLRLRAGCPGASIRLRDELCRPFMKVRSRLTGSRRVALPFTDHMPSLCAPDLETDMAAQCRAKGGNYAVREDKKWTRGCVSSPVTGPAGHSMSQVIPDRHWRWRHALGEVPGRSGCPR